MDIKRKIYDIRNWKKKHLFLDISSTNIDILVPSFYQWVETRKYRSFFFYYCLSHFGTSISTSSSSAKRLPCCWTQSWTALRDKHFPPYTGNISLWISFASSHFAKKRQHNAALQW
jgi:hypothetical protein